MRKYCDEYVCACVSVCEEARFPISLPLRLCLYLAPLTRYYHLFPKIQRSRDSEHIPFGDNILCMH